MKKVLTFFFLFIQCVFLLAQDSSLLNHNCKLPVGIYLRSKSFIAKKPDVIKPFEVVVNYRNKFMGDSIIYGNTFRLLDSTIIEGYIFGFYDGIDMYINIDEEINSNLLRMNKGGFFKVNRLARYSYILVERGFAMPIVVFSPMGAVTSITTLSVNAAMAAKAAANINKMDIYYFSKKRKLIKATPTSIGFLLKEEKDLYTAYQNEKQLTTEVMLRYLDKINDRYPDWEPEVK